MAIETIPRKLLGFLAVAALAMTVLFLVFFIADAASAGPLVTFEEVLAHARQPSWLVTLAYLNVTLLTLTITAWFAGLYVHFKAEAPYLAAIGVIFVPVYCVLNLCAYFSQITVVPRLFELYAQPANQAQAEFWLRQWLQAWPASAVSLFNNTAYGILGIPSILYGGLFYRRAGALRMGGGLLILNGTACITGVLGYVLQSHLLMQGSLVGAVFFLLALFPLSWGLLKGSPQAPEIATA